MKKQLIILSVVICLLPFNAFAEKMIFVTGGMSPPYIYDNNGKIVGMDVNVLNEFCKYNGIIPEFQAVPWKRALYSVKNGEAHGILSLFRTPERTRYLYYPSVPINSVRTVIIAQKARGIKINHLNDLRDMETGVIDGYKYSPEFDSLTGLQKTLCRTKKELITMLDMGRVDVVIDSERVFDFMCRKHGFNPEKFEMVHLITENPIYVAFSKKALGSEGAVLAAKLEAFLKELKEKNRLEKIRNQPY